MNDNFYSVIRNAAPAGDKPVFVLPDDSEISYDALFAMSGRMANALVALGVKPGDRVAAQVDKSWQVIALFLATLRAGGVYLPLNTGYTPAEIEYFLSDAEPAVFVCQPSVRDTLAPVVASAGNARLETLGMVGDGSLAEHAAGRPDTFEDVVRAKDDLAAILYTSGTTGQSKGAMLTHWNLASNDLTLREYWRFTERDVLIHALPIFHTHGLFVATCTAMLAGATMLFLPKFDADQVMRLMARATSMMGVPTFYTRLLAHPGLTREATAHMRLFVSGSAPLLAETHEAFEGATGHRILERYGMTECGMATSNPYEGERRAGTVGFALPDVQIRIADPETGAVLAVDEIGVLEMRGPNVFKGYWRMPEKTASEFRPDGYFISGDIARIDPDGYIHIVGRAKDLIISGGYNVYPKEIESEIDTLEGVVESAVIGVAHPDFGEGVTAVVVGASGVSGDEAALVAALESRLARYKLPKRVLFVDELPRNAMGKVQKNVLRATYADLYKHAVKA